VQCLLFTSTCLAPFVPELVALSVLCSEQLCNGSSLLCVCSLTDRLVHWCCVVNGAGADMMPRVAVIREEGSNGDREMAAALHMAGFQVWDVNMHDLKSGTATLAMFHGVVFVGGFSYADVLGSAKGLMIASRSAAYFSLCKADVRRSIKLANFWGVV